MGSRGRTSASELAVRPSVETITRPDAPYDLNDEQSAEWWAVVNRMPADWFPRETHALLADYCRHVVMARRIWELIAKAEVSEDFSVEDYDRLGKMAERESRIIASLATKMRISQQTSYDKSKKRGSVVRNPWDAEDAEEV